MTPAARLEVLVEDRPRLAVKGRANFLSPENRQSAAADLSSSAGMLAACIDLPSPGIPKIGPFGAFAGAGLGVVRTRIGQTRMTFPATTAIVQGASRTGFACGVTEADSGRQSGCPAGTVPAARGRIDRYRAVAIAGSVTSLGRLWLTSRLVSDNGRSRPHSATVMKQLRKHWNQD